MSSLTTPASITISDHDIAKVIRKTSNQQNALLSKTDFKAGDTIATFHAGTISSEPTYLTVQIDNGKHITLQPEFLQYINHSCEPNVFFNTTTLEVVALKDICPGEEFTFFYPSTEWEMSQPFHCYCGHANCLGEIRGAAYLHPDTWKNYRLTDYIQQQLVKRATRKVA